MVENVSDDALKFEANALRDSNVLSDTQVNVPVRQAGDAADTAVPRI